MMNFNYIIAVTRIFPRALIGLITAAVLMAASDPAREKPPTRNEGHQTQAGAKLDLNTAPEVALAAVPVIGGDGARAIMAARPFKSINGLDRVQGISAERLEQIRAQVVVSPTSIPPEMKPTAAAAKAAPLVSRTTREAARPKVDINTASLETLAALPPVGLKTAQQIVAARPFTRLDELNQLDGISTERLAHLQLVLAIGSETKPGQVTKPTEPPPVRP